MVVWADDRDECRNDEALVFLFSSVIVFLAVWIFGCVCMYPVVYLLGSDAKEEKTQNIYWQIISAISFAPFGIPAMIYLRQDNREFDCPNDVWHFMIFVLSLMVLGMACYSTMFIEIFGHKFERGKQNPRIVILIASLFLSSQEKLTKPDSEENGPPPATNSSAAAAEEDDDEKAIVQGEQPDVAVEKAARDADFTELGAIINARDKELALPKNSLYSHLYLAVLDRDILNWKWKLQAVVLLAMAYFLKGGFVAYIARISERETEWASRCAGTSTTLQIIALATYANAILGDIWKTQWLMFWHKEAMNRTAEDAYSQKHGVSVPCWMFFYECNN